MSHQATGTELRVCDDIASRQAKGLTKYGVHVENNPAPLREWMQHAYEETLDKAIYLKRAIEEMDRLPELIANDLFTNGQGEKCDRLVHTMDTTPKRSGVGWAIGPVIDRIRRKLCQP